MIREEEIQIAKNRILELIYEMYFRDLKSGNIKKDPLKSFGKICKKRNVKNDEFRLFEYDKKI